MEPGDLIAYERVTNDGEWSWNLGVIHHCPSQGGILVVGPWVDAELNAKRSVEQRYEEALRESEECLATERRIEEDIRRLTEHIRLQQNEVEESYRIALERLREAQEAVRTIDRAHLREMQSYRTPPPLVKETLGAVLHLLGLSPVPETWENVQKLVRKPGFINTVVQFNGEDEEVSASVYNRYLSKPAMNFAFVNAASQAAGPLLQWLYAKIGCTETTVAARSIEEELATSKMRVQKLTERQQAMRRQADVAREKAETLRSKMDASRASLAQLNSKPAPQTNDRQVWRRDPSAAPLTILTSSVLCHFGEEAGDFRQLDREDLDRIAEAQGSSKRDNNERLRFALETLSEKEGVIETVKQELRSTIHQRDVVMDELERERTYRRRQGEIHRSLEEEISRLRSLELKWNEALASAERQGQQHADESRAMRDAIGKYQGELRDAIEEKNVLKSALVARESSLEREITTLQIQLQEASEQLVATQRSDYQLRQQLEGMIAQQKAIEAADDSSREREQLLSSEIHRLQTDLEDQTVELTRALQENAEKTRRIARFDQLQVESATRIEQAEADMLSLRRELAAATAHCSMIESEKEECRAASELLNSRLAEATEVFQRDVQYWQSTTEASIQVAKAVFVEVWSLFEAWETSSRALVEHEADLSFDRVSHSAEIFRITHHSQSLEHAIYAEAHRAEAQYSSSINELESERAISTSLRSDLQNLQREHETTSRQFSSLQSHTEDLIAAMNKQDVLLADSEKRCRELHELLQKQGVQQTALLRERDLLLESQRSHAEVIPRESDILQHAPLGIAKPEGGVDKDEVVHMQERFERELRYTQSVHANVIAQHVTLESEQRSQIQTLIATVEQLEGRLSEAEKRCLQLKREGSALETEVQTMQIRAAASDQQLTSLQEANRIILVERDATLAANLTLRSELDSLRGLLTSSQEECIRLEAETAALQRALDTIEELESEQRAAMDEMVHDRESTESQLDADRAALLSQIHSRDTIIAGLEQDVLSARAALDAASREMQQLGAAHAETVRDLESAKKQALDGVMRELEAAWTSSEKAEARARAAEDLLDNARQHSTALEQQISDLRAIRERDADERQKKLEDLVRLHQEQLISLRKERDDAIHSSRAHESEVCDLQFKVAELVARSASNDSCGEATRTAEQRRAEELRSRIHELSKNIEEHKQRLHDKDLVIADLHRRVAEAELLAAERRMVQGNIIPERRKVDDLPPRSETQRRVNDVVTPSAVVVTAQSLEAGRKARNFDPELLTPPSRRNSGASRGAPAPPPLTPKALAQLERHRRGSSPAASLSRVVPMVDSAPSSPSRSGSLALDLKGAHLAVTVDVARDLQHCGKPLKATEIYAKLKTTKEKYRSAVHVLRDGGTPTEFREAFVFHLAHPDKDVVRVSIYARNSGSLFDSETHVGDVSLSMASLWKHLPRTKTVWVVQDAGTQKAQFAGLLTVTIRSDDFGKEGPVQEAFFIDEDQKLKETLLRYARDAPEKLHLADVTVCS